MTDNQQSSTLTPADFTKKDKIAVPTVKGSMQSTILGIAAEKMYGEAGRGKFDTLTVAMAHPDATIALLSGGEVNNHFSVPPYQYQELVRQWSSSRRTSAPPPTSTCPRRIRAHAGIGV